jgi:hypothetical protein
MAKNGNVGEGIDKILEAALSSPTVPRQAQTQGLYHDEEIHVLGRHTPGGDEPARDPRGGGRTLTEAKVATIAG